MYKNVNQIVLLVSVFSHSLNPGGSNLNPGWSNFNITEKLNYWKYVNLIQCLCFFVRKELSQPIKLKIKIV